LKQHLSYVSLTYNMIMLGLPIPIRGE
jgi:hypothetical protein